MYYGPQQVAGVVGCRRSTAASATGALGGWASALPVRGSGTCPPLASVAVSNVETRTWCPADCSRRVPSRPTRLVARGGSTRLPRQWVTRFCRVGQAQLALTFFGALIFSAIGMQVLRRRAIGRAQRSGLRDRLVDLFQPGGTVVPVGQLDLLALSLRRDLVDHGAGDLFGR